MTAPPVLAAEGLSGGYGHTQVLHDLALEVREGEIVALLGANGAGKSTLLGALMNTLPVRQGRVTFRGSSISALPTEQIVRVGLTLVPERRQLFGAMSVEENLKLGGFNAPSRAALRILLDRQYERFPILGERRRQTAKTLSGGQQQMLAIARGLMCSPKLLLLDEPSLGLAPLIVKQVFDELVNLRESGSVLLLVEQNARAALRIADRAYVMETGRLSRSRPAADVLADPQIADAYLGGSVADGYGMEQRIREKARAGRRLSQG